MNSGGDGKAHHSFNIIDPSNPDLPKVISLAVGYPTKTKVKKVLKQYSSPDYNLLGCFVEDKLIGIIGLQLKDQTKGIIQHIAILKPHQNKGMGRALIQEALNRFHLESLEAETDEESVKFYSKMAFTITPIEGAFGKRFNCVLVISH